MTLPIPHMLGVALDVRTDKPVCVGLAYPSTFRGAVTLFFNGTGRRLSSELNHHQALVLQNALLAETPAATPGPVVAVWTDGRLFLEAAQWRLLVTQKLATGLFLHLAERSSGQHPVSGEVRNA